MWFIVSTETILSCIYEHVLIPESQTLIEGHDAGAGFSVIS